jgi:hypothetical protein
MFVSYSEVLSHVFACVFETETTLFKFLLLLLFSSAKELKPRRKTFFLFVNVQNEEWDHLATFLSKIY